MIGVVLAGGKGSRMGSLAVDCPKVLIQHRGKPLLDYAVDCLEEARVDPIYVVIGHGARKMQHYCGSRRISYISGDSREHVFYAIWRGCTGTSPKADVLIFVDGDTILDRNTFTDITPDRWSGCDGVVICTAVFNTGSQWRLLTGTDEIIRDIQHGKDDVARAGIIFRRQLAEAIFTYADGIQAMNSRRFENQFLCGFEVYQLGWGLFLRIALNLGAKLKVIMSPFPIRNINRPSDLQ